MSRPAASGRPWFLTAGRTRILLTVVVTALATGILCVAGFAGFQYLKAAQEAAQSDRATLLAQSLVSQLRNGTVPDNTQSLPFEIAASTGKVLEAGGELATGDASTPLAPELWLEDDALTPSEDGALSFQTIVFTVPQSAGTLGGLTLQAIDTRTTLPESLADSYRISTDTEVRVLVLMTPFEIDAALSTVSGVLQWAVPLTAGLIAVVVWLSVGLALRPVEKVRRRVAANAVDRLYDPIPSPRTHDEVQRLTDTLNVLLAQLEAAEGRQRAFVSDAAHELRSPIATLLLTLEIAERYPTVGGSPADDSPASDDPGTIGRALRQAQRLQRLVDDLLTLNRADYDSTRDGRISPVSLRKLVEAVAAAHPSPQPVTIKYGAVDPVVPGPGTDIERALGNLLANAQRHAHSGITIEITIAETSGRPCAVVTVDNDGEPIPLDQLERIFDRMVRLDYARSRDDGGSGLGLAITRAIATARGGSVRAEPVSSGARFLLTLPLLIRTDS